MIELTPEQKKELTKEKVQKFTEGLKLLEKDTQITIRPVLQLGKQGIIPAFEFFEIPPKTEA